MLNLLSLEVANDLLFFKMLELMEVHYTSSLIWCSKYKVFLLIYNHTCTRVRENLCIYKSSGTLLGLAGEVCN